jgi:hypothetical protein
MVYREGPGSYRRPEIRVSEEEKLETRRKELRATIKSLEFLISVKQLQLQNVALRLAFVGPGYDYPSLDLIVLRGDIRNLRKRIRRLEEELERDELPVVEEVKWVAVLC